MIRIRKGRVLEVTNDGGDAVALRVEADGAECAAVAYPQLTGPVRAGDEVLLNTSAVALRLGSGGVHFVMANLSGAPRDFSSGAGHIMKLNYTPLQCKVMSAEEEDSPHHEAIRDFESLDGTPVVVGTLHSMLAPVCAAVRSLGGGAIRVAYVMSDAACLALAFSRSVKTLKQKGLLHGTVTYGQSFGGDVEAVNKFSALIAAKVALRADIIVVAMGVGNIGTGTPYGHSSIEQGEITNAAALLGGAPVGVLRISFADARGRHYGVSHHSLTALGKIATAPVVAPVPVMAPEKMELVRSQLEQAGITRRHDVRELDGDVAITAMEEYGIKARTMGRGPDQDREFFLSCGAAARAAVLVFSK
jgi:hypothetical protein